MFPIRDRTRRWICRTIFLMVGVAPTLSIIGWCMAISSPGHVADVRAQFADAIGLELRFEKFSLPRPGDMLLEGLVIADPETGESLAHIGQLEMRSGEQHPMWIISAAEINASRADWLLRLIERRLQLGMDGRGGPLRVIAAELSLRWQGGSQSFVGGDFQFSANENGRSLATVVRTANSAAPAPIEIKVDRSLDATGAPSTTVEIHSAETPLPCGLLAALAQSENHLGTQSTWQGTMKLAETTHRWRGDVQGRLKDVDLHAAVSNQFSQQLNGRADIELRRIFWENGRLKSCEVTVLARDGSMSGQLLTMSKRFLNLNTVDVQLPLERLITFNELHFDVSLDATGLAVKGRCGNTESGVVMRNQSGALAASASSARVNSSALINAIWLMQVLPITGER